MPAEGPAGGSTRTSAPATVDAPAPARWQNEFGRRTGAGRIAEKWWGV